MGKITMCLRIISDGRKMRENGRENDDEEEEGKVSHLKRKRKTK